MDTIYYYYKFSSWLVGMEMLQHLTECPSDALLVYFAYLATYATLSFLAKHVYKLFQGFLYAMWAFIKYHGACLGFQCLYAAHTPLLLGEKTLKAESVTGQTATDQGWDKGRSTRQSDDLNALGYCLTSYEKARVADAWRPGIAYYSDHFAALESFHDRAYGLVFVEFVVRHHGFVYVEVAEQIAARACVFCQDEVTLAQYS